MSSGKKTVQVWQDLNLDLITVNVCYFNEVSLPLVNRAKLKEEKKKLLQLGLNYLCFNMEGGKWCVYSNGLRES